MRWMPSDIPEMERLLDASGHSVAEMCRSAGIAETTWGRWKRKEFEPTMRLWRAVTSAFSDLTGSKVEAATERGAA